ncbi:MAG: serine/threonine protein kinase [Polyangiaceae bacterium]|jgi:serine/threonine-protein kinase|nr:serine/threonine protein kinase [Polyangiaceae bacterium]
MRTPDEQDASGLEGQTLGKKFLVGRLIGEGGMGAVYEAEHVVTKRRGALKLLHQSFVTASDIAERFLLEASAASRIGNPHIVETIDAGELASGELYIFMELLSGRALRELLREKGRIPFEEAREIVLQVADGLAAAHAKGIVHRDVKPDNLFLCAGARPFVKILDFGISKFAEQHQVKRLTEQGATLGTPHYMSPEQVVSKRDVDERVDVYALGVVLYECVSGSVPFDAETLPALSVKIFEGQYTKVSELVPGAPVGLDALIERALAREPGRRFSSVQELSDALDDLAVSSNPGTLLSHSAELRARTLLMPPQEPGSKPPKQRALVLGAVALLGLGGSALAFLRGGTTNVELAQPTAGSIMTAAHSAQSAPESTPEARATTSAVPTPTSFPSAVNAPSPRKAAPSVRTAPRSSAAADGLSERNPFAN